MTANYIFQHGNIDLNENKDHNVSSVHHDNILIQNQTASSVFLALFVRCKCCLHCDALSENLATCSTVSLYKHCTACLVYKCTTQSIFSILCSDCVNYFSLFNSSNSCCTLRRYLFIYVFIFWAHWKYIYLDKWFK